MKFSKHIKTDEDGTEHYPTQCPHNMAIYRLKQTDAPSILKYKQLTAEESALPVRKRKTHSVVVQVGSPACKYCLYSNEKECTCA